jgi:uncharacterized protein (TIRG00374 family)
MRESLHRIPLLKVFQWTLSLLLLSALIIYVGPAGLVSVLGDVRPLWVIAVVVASFALVLLGATNVWILLKAFSQIEFGAFFHAYVSGWAVGLVVPGQVGDASQVLVLKRYGVFYSEGAAAYVLDKAVSLLLLLVVAFVGIARYVPQFNLLSAAIVVAVLLSLGVGALVGVRQLGDRSGFAGRVIAFVKNFSSRLLLFRHKLPHVALNVLLTAVKWSVLAVCYVFAFRALATSLLFIPAATIPIMSTLVGYLPISAGGIGAVEVSAVYLFGLEGVQEQVVVGAYLLLRAVQYALASFLLLVVARGSGSSRADRRAGAQP